MALILGIETSCDETGTAVYDTVQKKILSHALFSQIQLHEIYGGVVPEIASRSQLEKIDVMTAKALRDANIALADIDTIAVTHKPGLVGSLLVGVCFAKGMAWAGNKKIIGIDHIEGHIFSSFLNDDGTARQELGFPHLCLTASGGHTALYNVNNFGNYSVLAETLDDAAGEAFDKVGKIMGFGYPAGPIV
jgi:N6-L-threonylcarbamoyladenine synthase